MKTTLITLATVAALSLFCLSFWPVSEPGPNHMDLGSYETPSGDGEGF